MKKVIGLSNFARGRGLRMSIVAVGIGVFTTGHAGAQATAPKDPKSIYAVLEEAPEKAKTKRNPLADDIYAVAAGGKLFERHCSECHGSDAGGTMHGANLLREEVQQASPGTLFWVLTNGVVRRGMPVWSKLPEPQRWQIVTFLQSLQPHSALPPMKSGDAGSKR
jgi:mono/diheme cytochrome c family protein